MSTSSYNKVRSNLTNNDKDIQGGEKKVMKKSLSVILTSAMALSMFSSVAFGKTSADFTDLKDLDAATKAKFDAMISAGIFDGVSEDTFGLKEEMNRAQFAKVAALLLGLKADATTSSFSDVKADDKANGYALPYIEALKTAGVTDGYGEGTYNPAGKVTKEQLATFLVRVLGKDADAKAKTGTDATVSDWAQGYVALALELKLLANGEDGKFGGQANATRDLLLTGAYEAKQQYVVPGKISLTEAKAVGVYKVQVTFNKPVDTAAAKFALTKGTAPVVTTTTAPVWSEDKKSVTLTTDSRISEGDYTVTLSGLDAANVDKTTATFKGTDEQVSKIDFVNAGDTVAYSTDASVKVKAVNQYGEAVSISTSGFTALVSGQAPTSFKKDTDGNFVLTFATKALNNGITQGNGIVPITVYFNNSNVTVSKNFKVGTVPLLSKIEAGKVTYSNTTTNKLTSADDSASIPLTLLDQYGNEIVRSQFNGGTPEVNASNINPVVTPYEEKLVVDKAGSTLAVGDLFDDNGNARIKVKLTGKVDKNADFTINIYGGSSSASATVSVGAGNLATKVEFDTSAVSVSATDREVFVPLIVSDANGNKLSAQDIVDNKARFTFSVSNGTAAIQETGADKGKLRLAFTTDNSVGNKLYISGQINQSQSNTFVQTSVNVGEGRYPDSFVVKTESAAKAILGADDKVVFQLVDQFGKNLNDNIGATIPGQNGRTAEYQIKAEVTRDQAGNDTDITPRGTYTSTSTVGNVTTYVFDNTKIDQFNKGFDTKTNFTEGKATIKVVIEKKPAGGSWGENSSTVSRSIQAVKADTKLTYSLNAIGSLFAAKDKLGSVYPQSPMNPANETLAPGTSVSQFDKSVGVTAKDEAGNKVKLPTNYITSLTSSDPNVILTASNTGAYDWDPNNATAPVQKAYVLGYKAGTATVSAVVYTNRGETINLSQEVTVKADPITVDSITAGRTSVNTTEKLSATTGFNVWQLFNKDSDNKFKVVDNYGIEYTDAAILTYKAVLGVNFTVNTTARTSGSGSVSIDPATGVVTVPAGVAEYVVTATAPNGKSVQIVVTP
ncbi:S-layer homology domain-containing protein [Paenibacillus whitsoniae]|uniref:S-layer homology domain-containing protein n=1 Tax=Paenibacillus whitsoniae TaxID=2496558 RepID=A0A430JA23_9BACL|nr:S-layer homology domain-containing protein [Paenibacillus whitsoniae]RTE07888.1 S-layer homology domain-containing protein [Paenibacillus whitsoniae]